MDPPHYVVWYGNDAKDWSFYVATFIDNTYGSTVHKHAIENLPLPLTDARVGPFKRTKVQIVILSPSFLEYIDNNPNILLGKLFEPSRVITIMCGVSEVDITSMHRANLISFDSWKIIKVTDKDPNFSPNFQSHIDEILQNANSISDCYQNKNQFKLHPCKVRESCSKILTEFFEEIPKGQQISVFAKIENERIPLKAKLCNPYLVKFVVPSKFFEHSQIIQIHVKCGAESLGWRPLKCESKMAELNNLLQTINTPLSFMCQTLGLTTCQVEELDRYLVNAFRKNMPRNGLQLLDFSQDFSVHKVTEEFPTLLHFAAKYGLNELCAMLLDCPGVESACQIKNKNGLTPADLAAMENHGCLASMLDKFMSLSETAEIYTYMKSLTDDFPNEDYTNLDARFQKSLKIAARLSFCFKDDYTKSVNTSQSKESNGNCSVDASSATRDNDESICLRNRPPNSKASNLHLYPQSQQELIQLLEDFKQEKYTISEVELLFHNWQSRQTAQSFEEKKDKLVAMQQQYEQIQRKCQEACKKRSALERFKSFLSSSVKKEDMSAYSEKGANVYVRDRGVDNPEGPLNMRSKSRPASAWSCSSHSSSMSDRSSTMSALSIASMSSDSGASSDIGEERLDKLPIIEENANPKLLSKTWKPQCMENKQYMFMDTTPPLTPERPPKKVPGNNRLGCKMLQQPSSVRPSPGLQIPINSYPASNVPSTINQKDARPTVQIASSHDSYSPLGIAPSPPDTSGQSEFEGYMPMDKNDFIFSKNEPNYCNTPKFPSESYLKMKSELEPPCNAPCPIASALVRNYKEVPGAFSYTNCQLEDTSYTERCDSVPDLPAPSIPVSIYPPNRILPLPCIGAEMPTRLLSPKFRPSTPPKMPTPKPPSPRAPLQNPSHKLTPSQIPTSKPRNKGFPLQKLS